MASFKLLLLAAAGAMAASNNLGPAGFMWPPDRSWSSETDNIGPCGSHDGVTNRTEFPLTSGQVSLVAQDDSYDAYISISFSRDPRTQQEFNVLLGPETLRELDPGHTCISLPDVPRGTVSGQNATLQIMYTADFDRPENQTFYACADITFVSASQFTTFVPCLNASTPEDVPAPTATGVPSVNPGHTGTPALGPTATPGVAAGSAGLSGGAIAGIVVGVLVAVAGLLAGAFFWYRERKQKNRLIRQQERARGVGKWIVEDTTTPKDSSSQNSIRLQNIGA